MNLFTPAETAENYSLAGAAKTEAPVWRLLLLGVLAGFLIAMGGAVTNTAGHTIADVGLCRVVSGLLFPFGLAMVVLTGAELFTGNTLIFLSVLDRRATVAGMLRNWVLVYLGNLAGTLLTAAGCAFSGQMDYSAGGLAVFTMKVAAGKCALPFGHALILGVLCNVLVTLAVLLALSAKDLPGRVLGAYLPVAFFVICGFEHSIANMFYIPAGLFAKAVPQYAVLAAGAGLDLAGLTWGRFVAGSLVPVTLGNIVGGLLVSAIFWACHLRGAQSAKARSAAGSMSARER